MKAEPQPCKGGCGRDVRPDSATKAEYPLTVKVYARGMCRTCFRRKPGQPVGLQIHRRPDNCTECKRPLRSSHIATMADPPGAIRYGGRGLCTACYDRLKRHGQLPPPGVHADPIRDLAAKASPYIGKPDGEPVKVPPNVPKEDKAAKNAAALNAWQKAREDRRKRLHNAYSPRRY